MDLRSGKVREEESSSEEVECSEDRSTANGIEGKGEQSTMFQERNNDISCIMETLRNMEKIQKIERQKEFEEQRKLQEERDRKQREQMKADITDNISKVIEIVETKFEEIRKEFKSEQKKFQQEIEMNLNKMNEKQEEWIKETKRNKEECIKKIQENVNVCNNIEEKIQERDNVIVQEIERIDKQIKNNQEKINKMEKNLNKISPEERNEEQKRQWLRVKYSLKKEKENIILANVEYVGKKMIDTERAAWLSFKSSFLRNQKSEDYQNLVEVLLQNFKQLPDELEIAFTRHLDYFLKNLENYSEEQDEWFHHDVKKMESRYQGSTSKDKDFKVSVKHGGFWSEVLVVRNPLCNGENIHPSLADSL
ncbi:vicilin-like seed storage protein At2g18540 [Anoplophora glabripennis]|uniref:vicilin-like seed storage protein At2g18540 n=1 Tax=Anoplophora glabripennis TaxID=217634 RepID=UPI000C789980|nr:vicilin-like seed storage protein At2g18540 [Anoplophora glabripennis]